MITFLSKIKKKKVFLDPFLFNFMRPKTWDKDFSKKRPKSIKSSLHGSLVTKIDI